MQEIQRKNCIFMHFCTFISHFNMSKSVSALFSVPQQHYFLPLYRVGFTLYFPVSDHARTQSPMYIFQGIVKNNHKKN